MAQAQRLPGPSWISLVYVIELIFIIKNVNVLQPVVRKDIKYIQNYNATQHQEKKGPLADGPASSGAFVPAPEQEDRNTLWSQTARAQFPILPLPSWSCFLKSVSFLVCM